MTTRRGKPQAVPDIHGVSVPERTLILLRDLVQAHTGMFYDESRLDFLRDRLAPLALDRGFDSLLDYYYLLKYDAAAIEEWPRAIDALSVQETYFWREFDQIAALTQQLMPRIAAHDEVIRIWCVPCASGEEPLSIAIALEEAGWFDRAAIEIHASDASPAALIKARPGRYKGRAFRALPDALRARYFDPQNDGEWTVKPSLAARIQSWTAVNVVRDDEVARLASARMIFCRNLFIYFTEATIRQVVNAFADRMPSPGYLCVGASESLLRVTPRFELQEIGGAFVYVKP